MIVLSNIPYKYDRFVKTDKEKLRDKNRIKRAAKRARAKRQKRMERNSKNLPVE